jgi:hypothetical protein
MVMAQQVTNLRLGGDAGREVIPFEGGVVADGPTEPGGYWRLRWLEFGRRRDTTARTRDDALARAVELSERLDIGTPTSHLRSEGTRWSSTTSTAAGVPAGGPDGPSGIARSRPRTAAGSCSR